MNSKLKRLRQRLWDADDALTKEINATFPVGTRVAAHIGGGRYMRGIVHRETFHHDVFIKLDSNGNVRRKHFSEVEPA